MKEADLIRGYRNKSRAIPSIIRKMTSPREIEMVVDSQMSDIASDIGLDKCVEIGCMVMIVPESNRDGFCQFHRRSREMK